ncbi:hypothetical protein HF086_017653 [Spodoptera exigua]|uniref:Uncharacterized protein n=1 Tax=Spodoptera exigua TaxID=7107 RepID=A0A922MMN1_SPOEX|nr:hypothetical protein HF086_017653 [Spodoptera exigua]
MEEENQQIPCENESVLPTESLPSTSRALVTHVPPPKRIGTQNLIDTYINKKISGEQKKTIDQYLLDLCVDGFHPFSIVEKRGFKKFYRWIPGYKLPTRKTLSLLDEAYNRVKQHVKIEVANEAQYICLTTDLWTSQITESYIGITGHYLTNIIQLKQFY